MSNKEIEEKVKKVPKKKTESKTNKKATSTKKTTSKENKPKKKITKKIDLEQVDSKIKEDIVKENIKKNNSDQSKEETKQENSQFGVFEYVLLLVIISLIFSLVGYFIGLKGNKSFNNDYVTVNRELREFIEEYNYILENYYGDVDESELINNAIKGMLASIDEYSGFIDDGSNNSSISLKGEYDGLGVGVSNDNQGNIVIVSIYENSPAEKAGLKVGDIVSKINGEDMTNQDNSVLVEKVSELDDITLTIIRDDEELEINLKKEHVVLQSVDYEMLDNNIGYIQVSLFAENTDEQFEEALTNLENQNMTSLIIDLRGNSGGHLTTVENMLSLFLNDTHIIYQTEDENGIDKVFSTGNEDKEYKIVILQDLSSASASEVMASALKEQLGAYIVGTTSFGKGTVQSVRIVEGIGQYKVTTMKWLTSNGVWIDSNGITPDLEVQLNEEYYIDPTRENDNQFQAAVDYLNEEN